MLFLGYVRMALFAKKEYLSMKRLVFMVILLLVGISHAQDESPVVFRESAPNLDAVSFQPLVSDMIRPLYLTHAGDERLFIVEQRGRIYVWDGASLNLFLDILNRVSPDANTNNYSERGLLGLAFHPNYAENGMFFVNYTNRTGDTVIARMFVSDGPNVANVDSHEMIFTQEQPFPNHNGGHMAFGPDGYLYVALGDGGSGGDPLGAGQDTNNLLGKILRLDVNGDTGYAVPADNPFANGGGAAEIWSYGWRNPWRFSFDRATGDMYIGEVGQNQWEEINFEPVGTAGLNYGWNAYEATHEYSGAEPVSDVVFPVAEYSHSEGGCSVTGGYVYRGEAIPDLQGVYFYGDFCSGLVWYAYRTSEETWVSELWMETNTSISSFGEDVNGELYLVDYSGSILKLVPNS
jgi:glucose/arabinose dehydrogenase